MNKRVYLITFAALLRFSALTQPYTELSSLKFQKYSSDKNEANEYSAAIFIPIKTKKNNYLIFGTGYDKLSLENSLNQPKIKNLETLAIQLGSAIQLDNDWIMTTILTQKISSDFEDFSKKDYQIGAVGFLTKQLNEQTKYKLGLFYNQEFWGPQIFPILGFDFIISNKLHFFGLIPRMINLEYKISESGYLGIKFNMKRKSYRLAEQYAEGYVQEFKIDAQAYLDYYLNNKVALFGAFGYALVRQYKIFETKDILPEDHLFAFNNQLMAHAGLAIRIRSD